MNSSNRQPQKTYWLRNSLIVLSVSVICFFAGGGWQLKDTSVASLQDYICYRAQGDDLSNNVFAAFILFVRYGGVAAVAGAAVSILSLVLLERKLKT